MTIVYPISDPLSFSDANVFTIDGYQGQEKEVVIISLTRCNRNYELGLFEDKRRMNVAITRAKRLCILVGDSVTYKHDEDYEVLFKESFRTDAFNSFCNRLTPAHASSLLGASVLSND